MSDEDNFVVPEELEEWIGLKKSEYLSTLIGNMENGDFGFEEYHLFDNRIPDTVEEPDRSYEETMDGYLVETYVRTYSDSKMYHHIVIGTHHVDTKNELEAFLPILSFVTRSEKIVGLFAVGKAKARPTMN